MKRSRFTEEQIIGILREQKSGTATGDVCRRHGISNATFYKRKAKFGGLDVSEARRLRVLEDENAKLKRLLAEAMLDNAMPKDITTKKFGRPPRGEKRWLTSAGATRRASGGRVRSKSVLADHRGRGYGAVLGQRDRQLASSA
jgi:putative transposase